MNAANPASSLQFGQIAWVVKDIQASEKYFKEVLGAPDFARMENLRAEDIEGTYYGKQGNFIFHLSLAYMGDTLVELIQPVSGQSIFQDYLDQHPAGGIQHIAFVVPEFKYEEAVLELIKRGYAVIQSLSLPPAKVAFLDTTKDIGIVTEIIGLTEAGESFVQQLKSGTV